MLNKTFFCDFQTLWKGMMMHALQLVKKVRAFGFFVFEPSFISYIERRGSGKKVVNLSVVEAQLFCVAQSVKSIRSILRAKQRSIELKVTTDDNEVRKKILLDMKMQPKLKKKLKIR